MDCLRREVKWGLRETSFFRKSMTTKKIIHDIGIANQIVEVTAPGGSCFSLESVSLPTTGICRVV
jgi:hypothetical protein